MATQAETIGYLLVQMCRARRNYTEVRLNQIGLHVGQEMLLLQLWQNEGASKSKLAEQLGVQPPTVTRMLQRMEVNGLLEWRPDPQDARVSCVYLTPQGRTLVQGIREVWAGVNQQTSSGLSEAEQATLITLLIKLRENLRGAEDDACPTC